MTERLTLLSYELDDNALMRLTSQEERETLTLDGQIRVAVKRLGREFDDLTEDEQLQIRNRLGVFTFYCAVCRAEGVDIFREDEWLCPKHRKAGRV